MVHDDFVHLMEAEFLPLHKKNPTHIRIDGQLKGGNIGEKPKPRG